MAKARAAKWWSAFWVDFDNSKNSGCEKGKEPDFSLENHVAVFSDFRWSRPSYDNYYVYADAEICFRRECNCYNNLPTRPTLTNSKREKQIIEKRRGVEHKHLPQHNCYCTY